MPAFTLRHRTLMASLFRALRLMAAIGTLVVVPAPLAMAADNSWTNSSGTIAWNLTDANWTAPAIWNNDPLNADTALFGSTGAGTINLAGTINARSLNFAVTGYTLSSGTLNLVNSGSGTLGVGAINVGGTASTTATINSTLTAPAGLIKIGDGVLVLGGSGNSINGLIPSGSGFATNVLIGSASASTYGGTIRLSSPNTLPAGTTVAIGNGLLDIGPHDVTLGGLTFTGTNPGVVYVADRQGISGTGTLRLTGPIRVVSNGLGWGNAINVPVDAGGGTLRVEAGGFQPARGIWFLKPISNGSLFKANGSGGGGITIHGNNTYIGTTTFNGGINVVGGTNASAELQVVSANVSLQGANGSYALATTVRVVGGTLTLDSLSAYNEGPSPLIPPGNMDNRLGTAAAVTLAGGGFDLQSGITAPINQTVASLNVPAGSSRIDLRARTGDGQTANLFVTGGLTIGPRGSLQIQGFGLQTTEAISPGAVRVVVNGSLQAEVNGIIPGLYGINAFMRNSSTLGVGLVTLASSDYADNIFGPTLNVNLTTALTLISSESANSLRTSSNVSINAGHTLNVGVGGILIGNSVAFDGPGVLAFGNHTGRIYGGATVFNGPISGTAGIVKSGGSATFNGDLSGLSGGITINGLPTVTLNTPTYSGSIDVLGGTLDVNADIGGGGPITLGAVHVPAGAIGEFAALDISNPAISSFLRNIATVGGDGTSPFASFTGLRLTTLKTAAQNISGNISLGTHLTLDAGGGATTTLSGQISGPGGLQILGGVVALTNAANTFEGGLLLNGGITIAPSDAALGTGQVRFQGATLRTDYGGTFDRGLVVLTTGAFDTGSNLVSINGTITGQSSAAHLIKTGVGTLTLNGISPYPGLTTVNGGSLIIAGGGSFGLVGSRINVNAGGTLAGNGTVNGVVTVNAGGTIRGGPVGSANLTVTGDATLNAATDGGGRLAVEVAGPAPLLISRLSVNGVLNFAGLAAGTPTPSDPKFVITLSVIPAESLQMGETYSFLIAETTQPGNIRRNGSALAAGTVIHPNDYILTSSQFGAFDNVQLAISGSGTGLVLSFTPVPEPASILVMAAVVLGGSVLGRRARRKGGVFEEDNSSQCEL